MNEDGNYDMCHNLKPNPVMLVDDHILQINASEQGCRLARKILEPN